jgi:hypothetical protein
MDNLVKKQFSEINLQDHFFDSLRANYQGFDDWFNKKAQSETFAYTYFVNGVIKDFLYLKDEDEEILLDNKKTLPKTRRLKIGTFKIERRGTDRGQRFMKRILDDAIQNEYPEVYVTLFDDTDELLHLRHFFETYGFSEVGKKTNSIGHKEVYLFRKMKEKRGDVIKDYPYVSTKEGKKYVLSIYPKYHTKLFSDSILENEDVDILKDISETNSIYKIYLCWMDNIHNLNPNDKLIIYRTKDDKGPAYYRSVASSLCTVVEVKTNHDFENIEEFVNYTNRYSVFQESDLRKWYCGNTCYIIKMLYNVAFHKRVIRKTLIENLGIPADMYWGFFELTDQQFDDILKLGEVDERYFID